MVTVTLEGPIWTEALLRGIGHIPSTFAPDVPKLKGEAAERAIFFAKVAGLKLEQSGDDVSIKSRSDTDAVLLEIAASEIMGYFGRESAQELSARRTMIFSRAAAQALARREETPAGLRSSMRSEMVETLSKETSHEGFFLTRSYRLRHPEFGGGLSETLTREVFVATDAAIVLPYDPARDRILLIEQFRMGPFGRGDPLPWVLEPVAGRVDSGETPEDAARRECLEEADLALSHLEHATSHYCSPGCSTEMFHCYVGLCDLLQEGPSHGGLDSEHEDLRRHVLPFEEAMQMTRTGEINVGPLFALLLWLERERPRLRASA